MGTRLTSGWAKGKTLVATTTAAATSNSGYIDVPADVIGGSFYFDITAASGTSPTLDFSIACPVGTTASPVDVIRWRSAQVSTAADYEITTFWGPNSTSDTDYHTGRVGLAATGGVISLPAPITDRIKITWTIGGTNPSFTFAVYFIPWRVLPAGGY